jgi:hypothetical protein
VFFYALKGVKLFDLMIRRHQKKMEFSKKIMIVAMAINMIVIIFACIMIAKTLDLSPLGYLIPSVAAEVATGTGFYYSKAKTENRIKLMKSNGIKPNEESFREY